MLGFSGYAFQIPVTGGVRRKSIPGSRKQDLQCFAGDAWSEGGQFWSILDRFGQVERAYWQVFPVWTCSALFGSVRSGQVVHESCGRWRERCGAPAEGGRRKFFLARKKSGNPVFYAGWVVEGGSFWKVLVDPGVRDGGWTCSVLFGSVRSGSVVGARDRRRRKRVGQAAGRRSSSSIL